LSNPGAVASKPVSLLLFNAIAILSDWSIYASNKSALAPDNTAVSHEKALPETEGWWLDTPRRKRMKIVLILTNWDSEASVEAVVSWGRVQMGRRGLYMGAVAIIPREFC